MEWIELKERKPDKGQKCLVCENWGWQEKISVNTYTSTGFRNEFQDMNATINIENDKITHWMPLPEKPKK